MAQTDSTSHNGHGGRMSFTDGAVRTISGIAEVTTSSIGALGGAAVGSIVGGVRGAVGGVADGTRRGIEQGSHSTPAALLTMAAAGAAGLVEWPVILTVGGAALVLRQLHERGAQSDRNQPAARTADGSPVKETTAKKSTARKTVTPKTTTPKSTASRPRGRATR